LVWRVGVFDFAPGGGAGGEGFGGLWLFHNFGFVIHFTLYGVSNRETGDSKRETERKKFECSRDVTF
jgi:hypothetical protein